MRSEMAVLISRLQVEEGFLDGLDLHFTSGLNVLIGPRGSGKTSIIELIRFAIGVPGFTDKVNAAATAYAQAVLASGRVTLTLTIGDQQVTLTRSADEVGSRRMGTQPFDAPIILSQNEIEQVGTDVSGRLRLIDGFRHGTNDDLARETSVAGEISSITAELGEVAVDLESLREAERRSETVPQELQAAQLREAELLNQLGEAAGDREQLQVLTNQLATAAVRGDAIDSTIKAVRAGIERIRQVPLSSSIVEGWPEGAGPDLLAEARSLVERARTSLADVTESLQQALAASEEAERANRERQIQDEDASRTIRRRLESLQEGAGAITRQVAELQVRNSQLEATKVAVSEREQRLIGLQARRDALLDELDRIRERRYSERADVAEALSTRLGPRVRAEVRRYGHPVGYQNALLSVLRGSGLQYNTLAPHLAARLSPRELAGFVESGDAVTLANLAEVSPDRAQRIIEHLRQASIDEVLTARVEDDVELQLLDGAEYKPTTRMSMGQRCTVVLPVLLSHEDRVVVVDQPEDHLDNEFIVDTVVRVVEGRSESAQTILATHNANIPVLGHAQNVVLLGSTGRRGFVRVAASLEDPAVVDAITTVMEGGAEAFRRRAAFYHVV
ncbi:MAG: AAA family ATPase [Chloroflexi bacterium]|nr:AAA family ATPase [Chloroflexota bacterium]